MWTELLFCDRTTPVARLKFKFNKQNPLYLQLRDAEPSLPRSFYNLKAAAVPGRVHIGDAQNAPRSAGSNVPASAPAACGGHLSSPCARSGVHNLSVHLTRARPVACLKFHQFSLEVANHRGPRKGCNARVNVDVNVVRGTDHAALNVMHGEHVLAPRRGLHRLPGRNGSLFLTTPGK